MPDPNIAYEELPRAVKNNLTPEQWELAKRAIIPDGRPVPETTDYINLKNGLCLRFEQGQPADGPLLPTHDLSGGHGRDDTQFTSAPPGAHMP